MARRPAVVQSQENPLYVTYDKDDVQTRALAYAQLSRGVKESQPVFRTQGTDVYRNIGGNNTSVRDGYGRLDHDYLRPESALPKTVADGISKSARAYDKHGIVRNIFDMMSDFTIQGITIYHPNEKIQAFYRNWFKKVHGVERSERFVNLLLKVANVVVERATARIGASREQQMRTEGADLEVAPDRKMAAREIPWRYTFINPLSLSVVSEELATLIGPEAYIFEVTIPPGMTAWA